MGFDPLSFIGDIGKGVLGYSGQKEANEVARENAERNIAYQKEFAQSGIQWKVKDAEAAGIHPLYALGANTTAFSPVSVGYTSPMSALGDMAKDMGQDLSRAVNATRTGEQRDDAFQKTAATLTLKNMDLKNELLASQIAKLRAAPNPPMPASTSGPVVIPEKTDVERTPVITDGTKWKQNVGSSDAQDVENRWGDIGEALYTPYVMWKDYRANSGGMDAQDQISRSLRDWGWDRWEDMKYYHNKWATQAGWGWDKVKTHFPIRNRYPQRRY